MSETLEVNVDALVGPSHHFGGLAFGNVASMSHARQVSNPRAAALEGLHKAWLVAKLGVPQVMLPCQQRPQFGWLHSLGFSGSVSQILARVAEVDSRLLSAAFSCSSMWVANAATIGPSSDSRDGQLHVSIANLASGLHRHLEAEETKHNLKSWLATAAVVHEPLPSCQPLRDEGAANHTRLGRSLDQPGIQIFVHGDGAPGLKTTLEPQHFPARQSWLSCQALIQRHRLYSDNVAVLQQSPEAIEAGVFHNDVIAVGHRDLLWVHEQAWVDQASMLERLRERYDRVCQAPLRIVVVPRQMLAMHEAVGTYLFNSQWVTDEGGGWHVLFPQQCEASASAMRAIEALRSVAPEIHRLHFVPLDQSMGNGGGPACLRLRVVMTSAQRSATATSGWLTTERYEQLRQLIQTRYRDRLSLADLQDAQFAEECWAIASDVRGILGFQP